jgi:predicted transcriptional regulator
VVWNLQRQIIRHYCHVFNVVLNYSEEKQFGILVTSNARKNWTFFSNYAHVLICLTQSPQPTTREMALQVGITERSVQRILSELVGAGVISTSKNGRKNRYTIDVGKNLRHALESHKTVGEFINLMDRKVLTGER